MGEIAALATALCWSLTSIQFTLAGQRIGSEVVNRARLVLAVLFLALAHLLLYGEPLPFQAASSRWGWLGLSGTLGLVIGDGCLFQSFLLIGPRRATLLMTLVPVISSLLAWGWLDEILQPAEIGAVLLTVGSIAWVVSEKRQPQDLPARGRGQYGLGVLLGLGGALGQALGLVTARPGLIGDFPPLSAALIRMLVASGVIWLLALIRGQVGATRVALTDRKARWSLVGGTLTGPFIGVWLSMVAVQHAHLGIASTLMALSPIMLIPLARWMLDEQSSPRAVVGTAGALAGAAIIFMT